jgi:thioredoxin 1
MILEITNSNFEELVLNSKLPMILTFYAPWCGSCKKIVKIVEKLQIGNEGKFLFGMMNTAENELISSTYSIRYVPSILVFKDEELVFKALGLDTEEKYREVINREFD